MQETLAFILPLSDVSARLSQVGGKGASLARMAAAGLPVPAGFHVTTTAYRRFVMENEMQEKILSAVSAVAADQQAQLEEASKQIAGLFAQSALPDAIAGAIRHAYAALGRRDLPVAVCSSATAEDLPELSFVGQQETYLNIHGEAMVLDAVKRCWASLWTARAIDYRARHGIAQEDVSLAVVVQELVPADASGIMFTANPLTGTRDQVMINAAWGLGEAIVGGLVTPDTVVVEKASGAITRQEITEKDVMTVRTPEGTHEEPVPADRRTQAVLSPAQVAELARIGVQIEDLNEQPMDIEWALSDGHFFIVQARPITTLRAQTPALEEWNDSLSGDTLWTCANVGEAVPDVMTPCTWSLIGVFVAKTMGLFSPIGRRSHPIGNIGGRYYMNVSLAMSASALFGVGRKRFVALTQEMFGRIPDDLEVPRIPLSRWRMLRTFVPEEIHLRQRVRVNRKKLPAFLAEAPAQGTALHARIQEASSTSALIGLWQAELEPFFHACCSMMEAVGGVPIRVRHKLRKLVGEADADVLLSGLNTGSSQLASLGPLLGLTQLTRGEIDRATFARQYGHRGPHEMEVSLPRPAEDPDWIDRQQAALHEAPVDVTTRLSRQKDAQAAAWERFQQRSPRMAARMHRRIDRAAAVACNREAIRSELVRVFWALPPYPTLIRGHFDPFQWAVDPQRRSDVFDASGSTRTPRKRYDHWLSRRGWHRRGSGASDRHS
jgi:rifampicin phosphotransferase